MPIKYVITKQPIIYTFGYEGWGSHVGFMKRTFEAHNKRIRGRGLRWIDVRLKRKVRAVGFKEGNVEKELGRNNYAWIKDLGNINFDLKKPFKLQDPKLGFAALDAEIERAKKDNVDLILFCHCPDPKYCHRRTIYQKAQANIKKYFYSKGLDVLPSEWPQVIPGYDTIDLVKAYPRKKFKCTQTALYIDNKVKIPGYISPYGIPFATEIIFRDTNDKIRTVYTQPTLPGRELKYAVLKFGE